METASHCTNLHNKTLFMEEYNKKVISLDLSRPGKMSGNPGSTMPCFADERRDLFDLSHLVVPLL